MTSDSGNIWGPTATFAIVAAVMGSIFLLKGPLESQRPQDQSEPVRNGESFDYAPARLWQDPIYAIQRHLNDTQLNKLRSVPLHDILNQPTKTWDGCSQRQLQLLVMMSGEEYTESREDRRRQRYAVVSALTDHDYVPRYAGRIQIGGVQKDFSPLRSCNGCANQKDPAGGAESFPPNKLVGFEIFTPGLEAKREDRENDWEAVVVVWVNSEDFGADSLGNISNLMEFTDTNVSCNVDHRVTVLLGPDSSGSLQAMLDSQQDRRSKERLKRLHILSPRATLPLKTLLDFAGVATDRFSPISKDIDQSVRRKLGIKSFSSVVASDDQVQWEILKELKSRGLFREGLPLIAIVSEQDSPYGRLLDDILEEVIRDLFPKRYQQEDIKEIVHEYGYLRGVDGELFGATSPSSDRSHQQNEVDADRTLKIGSSLIPTAHLEHSFGASQVDYIRRLADHIAYDMSHDDRSNRENAQAEETVRPVVVGILGSDVYDKLLILQALRDRLPRATFFTTDLDARLSDPDVYAWSRNLIIGSPYGLDIEGLKGAGFRGSYQTALYRAVELALKEQHNEDPPPPRLFEIGRTGPFEITDLDGDYETRAHALVHGDISHIRSRPTLMRHIGSVLFVFAPLLGLTIFSFAKSMVLHSERRKLRRKAHSRVWKIGTGILIVMVPVAYFWKTRGYEPWPFFEGISSQPTIILYLTTVVYALALILITLANIDQRDEDIHKEFKLPLASHRLKFNLGTLRGIVRGEEGYKALWIWRWRREVSGIQQEDKSVQACWKEYLMYRQIGWQVIRILAPVMLIVGSVSLYIWNRSIVSGPLLTRKVYYLLDFTQWLAIVALVVTVFFCSDTLNIGRTLMRGLARRRLVGCPEVAGKNDEISALVWKMDLLAHHTECVRPVAVRPFVLMFLLILARSTVLEGWVWTPEVVLFYTGLSFFVLIQAVRFQFEALRTKDSILSSLDELRHRNWNQRRVLSRIEIARATINGMNRGAFVPWTRQPIFQSLLLPVGAYGVVMLLDTIF